MVAQPDDIPPDDESGDTDDGYFAGLSDRQQEAIVALIGNPSVAKAAEACQTSERTLYRWLSDPTFATAYRRARHDSFAQAISMAQRYAPAAVNTLGKVMSDPTAAAQSRVSASVNLLKFARESIELDDMVGRIEALEQATKERAATERWR